MGKSFKDHSRADWVANGVPDGQYPGHDRLQLGCLQRIADATEAMAQNYVYLQKDRDMHKRWYEQDQATIKRLVRSNNALRGHINRMKKRRQ